ncbi:unnamed protein product [Closterium sp. Naga37s-1]|nr:unnamed protein product [Closterium sp. Naga37s-1]
MTSVTSLVTAAALLCLWPGLVEQRAVVLADGRPPIRYDVLSIDITGILSPHVRTTNIRCCTAAPRAWTWISELWCWRMGIAFENYQKRFPCTWISVRAVVLAGGWAHACPFVTTTCVLTLRPTPIPSLHPSEQQSVPGAKELTLPVKPIDSFTHRWEALRSRILSLAPGSSVRVVVVGGGAGGVELLLAMQQPTAAGLPGMKVLDAAVVAVRQRGVESVEREGIERERWMGRKGRSAGEAAAGGWRGKERVGGARRGAGLGRGRGVKLSVSQPCHSLTSPRSHPLAHIPSLTSPRSHPLAHSTGDKYAVFSRGSLAFEDSIMWTLKDRIDRAFMQQFNQLPAMPSPPLPTIPVAHTAGPEALLALKSMPMRCGGCGSKVGSSLLSRVLTRLAALPSRPPGHPEILLGLDSPDDAAVLAIPPEGKGGCQSPVLVQTVDFFRSFLSDPHTFGRIAALHALSDCFAMGADPVSALAIVTLPYGTEEKMEEELFQVMAGAIRELDAATCQLVGGHTVEGAELSLGFAVTGLADRDRLLRKAGMHEGDAIILTKPIGTGVIFAANMRCKAKGRWVDGAIDSMLVSNQKAASIALQHGALAATDVTGFGLLGHLVEMTTASRVTVTIDPSTIPIMDGARQCVEDGIFSSLQDSNLRLRRAITNYEEASAHLLTLLLFDPQTAGGLLFSFHP